MEANSPVGRVLVVDDDQVLRKALCGIVAEGGWETAETAETAVSTTVNSMWAALGDLFKCKLPNGIELSIPKLGVETRLIDFVEDDTKLVDKTTWFDFDRLLLSADRSATVVGELVKMGIDPSAYRRKVMATRTRWPTTPLKRAARRTGAFPARDQEVSPAIWRVRAGLWSGFFYWYWGSANLKAFTLCYTPNSKSYTNSSPPAIAPGVVMRACPCGFTTILSAPNSTTKPMTGRPCCAMRAA